MTRDNEVPWSSTRAGLWPGLVIEVTRDEIVCDGRTVGKLTAASASPAAPHDLALDRAASFELKRCLEERRRPVALELRRRLRHWEPGNPYERWADWYWAVIVAHSGTPMGIIKEIHRCLLVAGFERVQYAVQAVPITGQDPARQDLFYGGIGGIASWVGLPLYQSDECPPEFPRSLRLQVGTQESTITAEPDFADALVPADPGTGVGGHATIGRVRHRVSEIREAKAACERPGPADADCGYWRYADRFIDSCGRVGGGVVDLPDLRGFHDALLAIRARGMARFAMDPDTRAYLAQRSGAAVPAVHGEFLRFLEVAPDDDVPFCEVVAWLDFARIDPVDYDWSLDEQFQQRFDEMVRRGIVDPFDAPLSWNEAMSRRLLFPVFQLDDGGDLRPDRYFNNYGCHRASAPAGLDAVACFRGRSTVHWDGEGGIAARR